MKTSDRLPLSHRKRSTLWICAALTASALVWIAAPHALRAGRWVWTVVQIDRCLDSGGRWDAETGACSYSD